MFSVDEMARKQVFRMKQDLDKVMHYFEQRDLASMFTALRDMNVKAAELIYWIGVKDGQSEE